MKRSTIFFLLCFLLLSSEALSQITITTADVSNWFAAGKGKKELQKEGDTTKYAMNVGNASASQAQTWTLPSAQYADTVVITNVAPASTPYANDFPLATHVQSISLTEEGVSITYYGYFRIANDSLNGLGSVMHQVSGQIDTTIFDFATEFLVKMPVALGTVFTYRDSTYHGPGDYEVADITETFDAFGTVTLPNGTFPCLRSTAAENYHKYSGGGITNYTVYRFYWITKEGHEASALAAKNDQTTESIQVERVRYMEIINIPTAVHDRQTAALNTFALLQNYPNPFNPSTTIRYAIPAQSFVTIKIYDMLGREVSTLANEIQSPGWKEVQWNGANHSSGVYLYRITANGFAETKKLTLLK